MACLLVLCGSSVYDQKNELLSVSKLAVGTSVTTGARGSAVAVMTVECIVVCLNNSRSTRTLTASESNWFST